MKKIQNFYVVEIGKEKILIPKDIKVKDSKKVKAIKLSGDDK